MIASTLDQSAINSDDFGDDLELSAIAPATIVGRYFANSVSET